MTAAVSHPVRNGLTGDFAVPGDKSVSHRALIFAALAEGDTEIHGLLESEDVLCTAAALRAMGAEIRAEDKEDGRVWHVTGTGGQLVSPEAPLDLGNSGTSARLLAGVIAGAGITACLAGDASLSKRPMDRVVQPLSKAGAKFRQENAESSLPLWIEGAEKPQPIIYDSPVASAQVKSAVLLAGLFAEGQTRLRESATSRDHTERMLEAFGASVTRSIILGGGHEVMIEGPVKLVSPGRLDVPADPSSAAFPVVAALLLRGSNLKLSGVMTNPTRAGLFKVLQKMGADISFENERMLGGEPVADLRVRSGKRLKGIGVPEITVPSMIDEYPVLAVAAAFAEGRTRMEGLAELRVKESNRLEKIAEGLKACGVQAMIEEDDLVVLGRGDLSVGGGGQIETGFDHRIAMSFLVLGAAARAPVTIDRADAIATSFPGFVEKMNACGCDLRLSDTEPRASEAG
ncbi:MAG: 3-phosphoshikimate 1-carboxyvinyltransferase [Micavibrio sp.]|nr:MAG: 3-phosphoshikimate 1-carboxyvinyltransferase [Micavibrio sp.]